MNKELSIWRSSIDWAIVYSAEDAARLFEEHTGDSWDDYSSCEEWIPDDREEWLILWEDDPSNHDQPEGAEIGKTEDGTWYVEATQKAWIAHRGRGFLCSLNWSS